MAAVATVAGAALLSFVHHAVILVRQTGLPVRVSFAKEYRSKRDGESVVFPRGTAFTTGDLGKLRAQAQGGKATEWLEGRGGVAPDSVYLELSVSGNRDAGVRIVDVRIKPDCTRPLDGLLFLSPPAGSDDSVRLHFDLDDSTPVATVEGRESVPAKAWFPARTISLKKNEEQVILVSASTKKRSCSFFLNLVVREGGKESVQMVGRSDGSPFMVTARVPDRKYGAVYLGGVVCPGWKKANAAYFRGDYLHMCDG